MTEDQFDSAVQGFYLAAGGQLSWREALEPTIDATGAIVSQLVALDLGAGQILFSFEAGPARAEAMLDYIRSYHRIDPRAALTISRPVGEWQSCHEHFAEEFVARDRFYQEWLIPNGGRWISGTKLVQQGTEVVLWGLNSGPQRGALSAQDLVPMRRLATHLATAVKLYMGNRAAARGLRVGERVLERLETPTLLVDHERRICYANPQALDLLAISRQITDRGSRLACYRQQDDAELVLALRSMQLEGSSYLGEALPEETAYVRVEDADGRAIGMFIEALRPTQTLSAFGPRALALVMLHDPRHRPSLDPLIIASCFELTPAEARVAIALAAGDSVEAIAVRHGVSITTVRTQCKAVMDKTETRRQAELVSLLLSLPPTAKRGSRPASQ